MGVLNITPDSFSDGGRWLKNGRPDRDAIRYEATAMQAAGARLIDIGGESTRPGAKPVPAQEELDRVMPAIEAVVNECDLVISLDSSTADVIRAGARAGVGLINDVRALRREGALTAALDSGLPVCLMHMRGEPGTMQETPHYADVIDEVGGFLRERAAACIAAGISAQRILLDPGFGFGKNLEHNLALLAGLDRIAALGHPLVVGLSRKSLIAKLTGRDVGERLPGSLALALLAAQRGASVLRVHDVGATADVLRILMAIEDFDKA
jgi:dihydropteroate synthase